MDLRFTPEERAFREEVCTFIRDNLPADTRDRMRLGHPPRKQDTVRWQRILNAKGWAALSWPNEWGGPGWTAIQRMIFLEENLMAPAPELLSFNITMIGPVLIQFGTDEQKQRFLPRAANLDDWWCQGFSEPGAGSDLASLKTAARLDGDHYVVNGQKIWTSTAHHADWCFVLARTDPKARKRQEGISFLLVDMKSPGVTVRPIQTIDGGHEVNEVFLENVKVPVENRVGEENKGWTCAKFLLAHERSGIAGVARSKRGIERLREIASAESSDAGGPLIADPQFKRKVAELEIDLTALEYTELRTLAGESAGKGPGVESSLLKIKGTEIGQRLTELVLEAAGHYGAPYFRSFPAEGGNALPIGPEFAHRAATGYFNMRKTSIFGGSNEIQRNIIAKMVLGL